MSAKLDVVLCWHMHQPWYVVDGEFTRPWVYLHALKDYSDMAAHLESQPQACAVVNFVPVLIEQIERYADAVVAHATGSRLPDPLLEALAEPLPEAAAPRAAIAERCLAATYPEALRRHAAYARVVDAARALAAPGLERYLSASLLDDLLVWTHLVWLGEHDHREDPLVTRLVRRGAGFDRQDRAQLFALVGERLRGLLGRYRSLVDQDRIEISVSPWAHPLLPLLLDFEAAHETTPEAPLPEPPHYPGGRERARWHLQHALETAQRVFGRRPVGCWPPEAALSAATLDLLSEFGFEWTASSGAVLASSLRAAGTDVHCVHGAFRRGGGPHVFFRDDGLSDLIGFSYKNRPADAAVQDLIGHLERIAAHCAREDAVVTIALDGENAWAHYPHNAFDFLSILYRELSSHATLRLTTCGRYLARNVPAIDLARVTAGSWVYGTLSTWIGHRDKNRAWEHLIAAKLRFDALDATSAAHERLLAVCEGSDWYWWLGDDNAADVVASFDQLFRAHLRALYHALGERPPAALDTPFSLGSQTAAAHDMRPTVDLPEGN